MNSLKQIPGLAGFSIFRSITHRLKADERTGFNPEAILKS
jgi:hypothetical protein